MKVVIRTATNSDESGIWHIFSKVIRTADTYVYAPNTTREALQKYWLSQEATTFVALNKSQIVGTYFIKPNHVDLGSHIANCGYMVNPDYQGHGIGKQMCTHSIEYAKSVGYLGMQFNIVVSTNTTAIRLWKKLGFEIIGTTPNGFRHPLLGFVDTHIMYKRL